jgi:hypothetical protein
MKKSELRQVLKPLIKECIKEVIFEEGILSNIVSEVAQGLGGQRIVEQAPPAVQEAQQEQARAEEQERIQQKLQETRKRMLDAIGGDAYNGVDVFAGTTPAPAQTESKQGDPLSGVDPRDPGVDINQLFGGANKNWSGMIK